MTPVASSIREVIAARYPMATNGSWNESCSVYGPPQRRLPVGVLGTHHVVVEQQAVVAERLDRQAQLVHARRVPMQLVLRVDDPEPHAFARLGFGTPPSRRGSMPASFTRRSVMRHVPSMRDQLSWYSPHRTMSGFDWSTKRCHART